VSCIAIGVDLATVGPVLYRTCCGTCAVLTGALELLLALHRCTTCFAWCTICCAVHNMTVSGTKPCPLTPRSTAWHTVHSVQHVHKLTLDLCVVLACNRAGFVSSQC
jgi:hypothetical protein